MARITLDDLGADVDFDSLNETDEPTPPPSPKTTRKKDESASKINENPKKRKAKETAHKAEPPLKKQKRNREESPPSSRKPTPKETESSSESEKEEENDDDDEEEMEVEEDISKLKNKYKPRRIDEDEESADEEEKKKKGQKKRSSSGTTGGAASSGSRRRVSNVNTAVAFVKWVYDGTGMPKAEPHRTVLAKRIDKTFDVLQDQIKQYAADHVAEREFDVAALNTSLQAVGQLNKGENITKRILPERWPRVDSVAECAHSKFVATRAIDTCYTELARRKDSFGIAAIENLFTGVIHGAWLGVDDERAAELSTLKFKDMRKFFGNKKIATDEFSQTMRKEHSDNLDEYPILPSLMAFLRHLSHQQRAELQAVIANFQAPKKERRARPKESGEEQKKEESPQPKEEAAPTLTLADLTRTDWDAIFESGFDFKNPKHWVVWDFLEKKITNKNKEKPSQFGGLKKSATEETDNGADLTVASDDS